MSTDDFMVGIDDAYKAGYCSPGIAKWCRDKGISLKDLMKCRVPASVLLATDDAYAIRTVERARLRLKEAVE